VNEGFLGTAAPRYADVIVLIEISMGVALLVGAVLARMRRFRLHAWCQSAIVLLNLVVIVLVMLPSFHVHVSPKIPVKLGKAYYALATAHGALGSVTEIAGLYILLAAGTNVLPHKFRVAGYKLWMRSMCSRGWFSCWKCRRALADAPGGSRGRSNRGLLPSRTPVCDRSDAKNARRDQHPHIACRGGSPKILRSSRISIGHDGEKARRTGVNPHGRNGLAATSRH
jgi:hypothetical protein